jgi:hypothetical protein
MREATYGSRILFDIPNILVPSHSLYPRSVGKGAIIGSDKVLDFGDDLLHRL